MSDAKSKAVELLKDFFSKAGLPLGPRDTGRLEEAVEALIEASVERMFAQRSGM